VMCKHLKKTCLLHALLQWKLVNARTFSVQG
jgi:hypothetical protein